MKILRKNKDKVFNTLRESDIPYWTLQAIVEKTKLSDKDATESIFSLLNERKIRTTWDINFGRLFYVYESAFKDLMKCATFLKRFSYVIGGAYFQDREY